MDIKVIIGTIGFGWLGWIYGVSSSLQHFMGSKPKFELIQIDPIYSTILGLLLGYYISSKLF